MPVLYENLPDFCFCCAHIGYQYRECLKYKGQPKEELLYGGWMRATSQSERVKLNQMKEKDIHEQIQVKRSDAAVNVPKPHQSQSNSMFLKDYIQAPWTMRRKTKVL